MSASMLRQMLTEAAGFLREERFQEALDASRRVAQLDGGNFQAVMCVGMASQQLELWDDAEDAFRRAAGLKPELPAPWKSLVDLYSARSRPEKKIEALEKFVEILHRNEKIKPCQKWIAEIAITAVELKRLPRALDAWYSLVGRDDRASWNDVKLAETPNTELQAPFSIWLDIVELLQRPDFELSECGETYSMSGLSEEFFAVAAMSGSAQEASDAERERLDAAIAFFMRYHLDELQRPKAKKAVMLGKIDELARSIIQWNPTSKLPAEYLLLRSEDENSPVTMEEAREIAATLAPVHARSPMVLIFQAVDNFARNELGQARRFFLDGLSSVSSSSFQESALCIRAQIALASISLDERDVEGCLNRLALTRKCIQEKHEKLGCGPPSPSVYSEARAQFMEATAREYAGAIDQALASYRAVIASGDASLNVEAALGGAELLLQQARMDEALEMLDEQSYETDSVGEALIACTRGWILFNQGDVANAQKALESMLPKIPSTNAAAKGRAFKRLAVVYWNLSGSFRAEKTYCFGHLLQAAKLVPSDSETFAWLGKWYHEVAKDVVRAEKCFLKALSLFPRNELAGVELSDLYAAQGKHYLNVKLWEDVTAKQEHAPTWALLRLAQHLVDEDNELAVGKLHLALRNDPLNATYWVALAHVYAHFGKQVSAHKSYLKAIELGEDGWCVRLELARIEGSLHLFEDALGRIAPMIDVMSADDVGTSVDCSAVSMVYADLLFREAKSLCADGHYGRAASNLLKASHVMKELPSSSTVASSPEALKLIGDLHSFAFYLSPSDFNAEGDQGWIQFINEGRRAYKAAVTVVEKHPGIEKDQQWKTHVAELYYDIGLNCWYEALATANTHSIFLDAFACGSNTEEEGQGTADAPRVQQLRQEAVLNFRTALQSDPALALAWNGLALAHTSVLVKQFAWTRAVQASNHEAAWANLGMFYLAQCDALPTVAATLAQRSFLQLQSVNPDNPAMWNGYAMLARRQSHSPEQRVKAIEAFSCALKNGTDLDALLGLALLLQEKQNGDNTLGSDGGHSDEEILFYLRKYLERDPFHPGAWNALGVVQQRLGLYSRASASFARASRIAGSKESSTKSGLEWNERVAAIGAAMAHSGMHETQKQTLQYLVDAVQTKALKQSNAQANALVLTAILKAQQYHAEGSWAKCLDTLQQILYLELETLASNVASGVGVIGLALSALVMEKATSIRANAVELTSSFIKLILGNSSAPELQSDRQMIELYERLHGAYGLHLVRSSKLDAGNAIRLGLAMVDSSVLSVKAGEGERKLSSYVTRRQNVASGKDTADATTLQVLGSLYFSNAQESASNGMKLVRMQPWNPFSYVVAGVGLLKHVRHESDSDLREVLLTQLTRLLRAGHHCALAAKSELDLAQLELLFGYCYSAKGDTTCVKEHADRALERLGALSESANESQAYRVQLSLLQARLYSIADPKAAALEYQKVIRVLSEMTEAEAGNEVLVARATLTAALFELGEFYEEMGELDGAIQVWRLLTNSVFSPDATSSEESPAPDVSGANPGFLANLRLALAHGKKRNTKPAKKHIKAALSLAGDDTSDASTVAAFVEKVLAA